jgi:TolB-like protein/Tfp pilus assembly protein PilF
MKNSNFFAELKRRNVYKVAVAYLVASWLLVQVATQVFPFFDVPNWAVRLVVLFSILGFPIALSLSWAFELTPEGIKRESEIDGNRSMTPHAGRRLVAITCLLATVAAGLFLFRSVRTSTSSQPIVASAIPAKSIAVLPFENLSDDKQNEYFSEGIQDEILTELANIGELKVISRTSTRRFKGSTDTMRSIGQQLGVAHLLEGSVQKSNDQVRVNVQLIDSQKDVHLWAQTYDRTLHDIFAVEAEIARKVAGSLQARLTGTTERLLAARPTENAEAHELYLKGAYYSDRGSQGDYRQAIDYYNRAITLDQNYAGAYVGLANVWTNLARKFLNGADAQQAYTEARAAIRTALTLEPESVAARRTNGLILYLVDFKWTEAEAELRRALKLAPNDEAVKTTLAGMLAALGRTDEAVELAQEGLANNPLCASCHNWLASYLCASGRLDEAERAIQEAIRLQPEHADFHTQLAIIAILRGDAKTALGAAQREVADGGWQEIALALAQQISGDTTAADATLKALIDHQPNDAAFQIAQTYALRNEPDKVFEWLDRAYVNRDPGIDQLLYDPILLRYKGDPRFATFCRKVGLPIPAEAIAGAKT